MIGKQALYYGTVIELIDYKRIKKSDTCTCHLGKEDTDR
jgi:hypothetical protein